MECKRKAQSQTPCDLCIANNQQCEFTLAFINGVPNPARRNHVPQDYQMQLMLLEQQNKKRLLMAQNPQNPYHPGPSSSFAGSPSFSAPASQVMIGQQQVMSNTTIQQANQLGMNNGIHPGNFSTHSSRLFHNKIPSVQQKSIQVYGQNLAKNQHDSMRNAGGISDRQPPAEHGCGSRSNGPDVYVSNDSAALQTRVDGVSSDSDANGARGAPTTPTMQAHAMPPGRPNEPVVDSPDFPGR